MDMNLAQRNLKTLLSSKRGGGLYALMQESIGGNAGQFEGYPCACVNFAYDPENGIINTFSNGRAPHGLHRGSYLFVIGYRRNTYSSHPLQPMTRIVEISDYDWLERVLHEREGTSFPRPSKEASHMITTTALLFNEHQMALEAGYPQRRTA